MISNQNHTNITKSRCILEPSLAIVVLAVADVAAAAPAALVVLENWSAEWYSTKPHNA